MKKSSVIKKLASKNVSDIQKSASVLANTGKDVRSASNVNKTNEASCKSYEGLCFYYNHNKNNV